MPKNNCFKIQDSSFKFFGEGRGGRGETWLDCCAKVNVLIVATDPRLWLKFQVSKLKARDFTPVLQHHGRLLRDKRNRNGLRFLIRSEGNNDFLFRPSGRHLEISSFLIGAAFSRGLTTLTDELPVKVLRASTDHHSPDSDSSNMLEEESGHLALRLNKGKRKEKAKFRAHVLVSSSCL